MIRSFLNIQFTSYVLFVYRLLLEMPFTMWDFMCVMYLVTQLCLTPWDPMDYSLPDSSVHGDFSGKNTAVGCHALLQGIFPTKKMNPGLPHCRIFFFLPSEPPGKLVRLHENLLIVKTKQKHPLQENLPWFLPRVLHIFFQALLSSGKILGDEGYWCNSTLLIYNRWHSIWKTVILISTVRFREFSFPCLGGRKITLMARSLHDNFRIKRQLSCMSW